LNRHYTKIQAVLKLVNWSWTEQFCYTSNWFFTVC